MNKYERLRAHVWVVLEGIDNNSKISRAIGMGMMGLILLNVIAVIAGSMKSVAERYGVILDDFEIFSVLVFSIEYAARAWACTSDPRYSRRYGRLRYLFTPLAIVDLLAITPFFVAMLTLDLRILRMLRLVRAVRLFKITRYNKAIHVMMSVVRGKKDDIVLVMFMLFILMVISSCLIYYCENGIQPEAFPDMPTTAWWALMTITTVDHGDVYPISAVGRVFAGIIAMIGVLFMALPTAILSAGYIEAVTKKEEQACPHCGKPIDKTGA